MDLTQLREWAQRTGVAVRQDAGTSAVDYGRWRTASPAFILTPKNQAGLGECLRMLRAAGIPYMLRGAGHSSGGQTLIDGGAVIELHRLCRVIRDDPAAEEITVEGGISWLALLRHLVPQGRRPQSVTTSFRATVAGTVAAGGFGDTTHLTGLVTASVARLVLFTPDGVRHEVSPGDPLFDYSLAGRGQLGVIAQVTLKTLRRSLGIAIRRAIYNSLTDLLRDALVIAELRLYEFLRARLYWNDGRWVAHALFGHFIDEAGARQPLRVDIDALRPAEISEPSAVGLYEYLQEDADDEPDFACPAVEFALPLPDGVESWGPLGAQMVETDLVRYLKHGISVMVVSRQAAPLAPLPDSPYSFLTAVRPQVPVEEVAAVLPHVRSLGKSAIAAGGRLYLISVEPEASLLRAQFGAHGERWAALRRTLDPDGRCNPGLLE
jgi:cytokinin dehydrogenase